MSGIYKVTVRVEIPVIIDEADIVSGSTWDDLRATAARAVEVRLGDLTGWADISALTGPGSGGYYPDGMEHDFSLARDMVERKPVIGLKARGRGAL